MHGAGDGAPKGNKNALKHGGFTAGRPSREDYCPPGRPRDGGGNRIGKWGCLLSSTPQGE
jgi:hypothetical protein